MKIGKIDATCDFCHLPKKHVVTLTKGAKTKHYCSQECFEEAEGVATRIHDEVRKQVKEELLFLHKKICPNCKRRLWMG